MRYRRDVSAASVLNEIGNTAVVGPFAAGGKETAGNLSLFPVVGYAFAAVAALVAGGIGAGAVLKGLGGDAFHNNLVGF
jgi:hypothetical protein